MGDEFAQLQAILAGLPMHAVPASSSRSCGPEAWMQCGGKRKQLTADEDSRDSWPFAARQVKAMLAAVATDYPAHEEILRRLHVEGASLDLVCFADHAAGRLFAAVRGTDRSLNPLTTPDDVRSNMHVILGYGPARAEAALSEYRTLRRRFPHYDAFGCGHSLGGAVILHVAKSVEEEPEFVFTRIDVFNTAMSPLPAATPAPLAATELHVHRVSGDWASWGLRFFDPGSGKVHTHNAKTSIQDPHSLRHFLPDKSWQADGEASETSASSSGADQPAFIQPGEGQAPVSRPGVSWEAFWSLATCVGLCRNRLPVRPHAPTEQPPLPRPSEQAALGKLGARASSECEATCGIPDRLAG